jgi:predicted glycosyltransferase
MKILFELNHPAHGHLFKNPIKRLRQKGHEVTVLIKDIPVLKSILEDAGIEFINLGAKGKGAAAKFFRQFSFLFRTWKLHRKIKYDLGIGVSVTLPLLSRITSMHSIVFDDDDKKATPKFAFLAHRNASLIFRPAALKHEGQTKNTIYYNGYHELAYLHPRVFQPDISVLKELGLAKDENFFIVRLVALEAHHDKGIHGISQIQLEKLVEILKPKGRVILTHEAKSRAIPGTEPLHISPARLHHLMYFARLIVSDGQTMCSEAACLGVPSVRINDFAGRISYLEEQEHKWNLTFGFRPGDFESALQKIENLLQTPRHSFREKRGAMIAETVNPADLLIQLIENWPASLRVMREDPGFVENFKNIKRDEK